MHTSLSYPGFEVNPVLMLRLFPPALAHFLSNTSYGVRRGGEGRKQYERCTVEGPMESHLGC